MKNIFTLMAATPLLFTGCGAPPDKAPKEEAKVTLGLASVTAARRSRSWRGAAAAFCGSPLR